MKLNSELLIVTKEEVDLVRKAINLTDELSIRRDVDMVLEWFEKQQHLPRIQLDRGLVERILVSRKGSVEQTKQKIDMMYTLRTLIPDLAAPRDILNPRIQKSLNVVHYGVMPKLSHDQTRINILKFTSNVDDFDFTDFCNLFLMVIEYRLRNDYCSGDRYVCDYSELKLGHLTKFNPITIKNVELYVQKGYGIRVRSIHYINAPNYINKLLAIVRSALSEKLSKRLFVHETHEDLHNYVSKESLPEEYGGTGGKSEHIFESWRKELSKDEVRKYLIEQETLKSDEKLRIGGKADDDALGIPGSFKKLSVD